MAAGAASECSSIPRRHLQKPEPLAGRETRADALPEKHAGSISGRRPLSGQSSAISCSFYFLEGRNVVQQCHNPHPAELFPMMKPPTVFTKPCCSPSIPACVSFWYIFTFLNLLAEDTHGVQPLPQKHFLTATVLEFARRVLY